MKEHIDRDEYSGLMTCAFDHAIPGEEVKNNIYANIMDECESSKQKRTSMENIFLVRRVCMVCVTLLAIIIISGGTITSVNSLMKKNDTMDNGNNKVSSDPADDGNKDDSNSKKNDKGEAYRKELVKILRGEDTSYDYLNRVTDGDGRLADTIENMESEFSETTTANYRFAYLGTVSGSGISDGEPYKDKDMCYSIVRVENLETDSDSNYYQFNVNQAVLAEGHGEDGEAYLYDLGYYSLLYRIENGRVVYMIINMAEMQTDMDREVSILASSSDVYNLRGETGNTEEEAGQTDEYPLVYNEESGLYIYNQQSAKEHALFSLTLPAASDYTSRYNKVYAGDYSLINEMYSASKYTEFNQSHAKSQTIDGVEFALDDNHSSTYDKAEIWNVDKGVVEIYTDFDTCTVTGDSVMEINLTISQGEFVEKVLADEKEERHHLENGYFASKKTDTDPDKPYTLYKRCCRTS